MSNTFDVALVGATSMVGEAIVSFLAERNFPMGNFFPLASADTAGKKVEFGGKYHTVKDVAEFDFSQVTIAVFCAGDALSTDYVPRAIAAGCTVVDTSAQFVDDDDVPLVIPEVNPRALAGRDHGKLVVSPDSATVQMLVALKPIYDAVGIDRINVVSYQAVTALGKPGMDELAGQTIALLNMQDVKREVFPQQIAFNVLPQVDAAEDNGYLPGEMKMLRASQKILADSDILIYPTIVQAPVFFGHSQSLQIETSAKLGAEEAKALLRQAPGVVVADDDAPPTAVSEATGKDAVFVGRIREDFSHPCGLGLWVVADNVRRGSALNCVQIIELLVKDGQR